MIPKANRLIPLAHSADVQRAVDFYRLFGMQVRGSLRNGSGELQWAHIACEHAELMFARAEAPVIAGQHPVLFYLYSPDLLALRDNLVANGVSVSDISYPSYMPQGEMCAADPDGYVLLIGQPG